MHIASPPDCSCRNPEKYRTLSHIRKKPPWYLNDLFRSNLIIAMSTWDWESWGHSPDPFLDKEQFFSGLYSLASPPSGDQVETSEASLSIAASKDQRYKRIIHRSSRVPISSAPAAFKMSTSICTPKVILTAPPALEPPVRSSLPPESSRMLAVELKATKRKRVSKAMDVPAKERIFGGMYFYFVPNDLKNPARKFRVQKTDEHGGFCLKEWREKNITHVIVDAKLMYSDVLKHLQRESIPDHIILVNDIFIGDCLAFARVVNYDQPQYKVPGKSSISLSQQIPISPPPLPSLPVLPSVRPGSSSSVRSLQIKPARSRKPIETPRGTQETSTATEPTPNTSELQPESQLERPEEVSLVATGPDLASHKLEAELTKVAEAEITALEGNVAKEIARPKDELDVMIMEAMKMGDLPLDDDQCADQGGENSSGEESPPRIIKRKRIAPASFKAKNRKWQDKFQCMHSNDGLQSKTNPNARTIEILLEMQKFYEMIKDPWRSISYRKGINTLRKQEKKICSASEAKALPMIGESLANKIEEIVRTDHLRKLDYAQLEPGDVALKLFLGIYGVGPSLASQWVQTGYKTLQDLLTHVRLSASQKIGIDHYDDFATRIPRAEVNRHGDIVMEVAAKIDQRLQLQIMGSYRRGAKDCGDIDIMITKEGASAHDISDIIDELVERLFEVGFLMCGLAISRGRDDGSKWHGASKLPDVPQWRRIDFLVVPWDERGAALLYFTGNDIFNRSMRLLASKKGYGLNQRGLFKDIMRGPERQKLNNGTKVAGDSEEKIFEILGVPYRRPEERIC